jgi:hypothetical protein
MEMKLRNAKDEKITTIFGVLFLLIDAFLLVVDVFKDSYEIDWKVLLGVGFLGLGLILAPDDLYGLLKNKSDKII